MSIADIAPESDAPLAHVALLSIVDGGAGANAAAVPDGSSRPRWGMLVLTIAAAYALAALGLAATSALTGSVSVLGHKLALHEIHDLFFRFSLIGMTIVPAIFLLEALVVGWRGSSIRELVRTHSGTMRSDMMCFLLGHLRLMRWPQIIMTFGLTLVSGIAVHNLVARVLGIDLSFDWLPPAPRIMAFYLIYTFFDYWAHRIDHMSLLWPLHRYHHAAQDFVVLTAARGHPGSTLTQVVVKTFPMATLGMSMTNIIDLNMLIAAAEYFTHSRIPFRLGWVGGWVIQSPPHHRLHHVKLYDGHSWNYGMCPLWDRLFGTWREVGDVPIEIGIDYDYAHGAWIVRDMLRDYREFLAGLMRLPRQFFAGGTRRQPRDAVAAASDEPPPALSLPTVSLPDAPAMTVCDTRRTGFDAFLAQQPSPANGDAAGPPATVTATPHANGNLQPGGTGIEA